MYFRGKRVYQIIDCKENSQVKVKHGGGRRVGKMQNKQKEEHAVSTRRFLAYQSARSLGCLIPLA